MKTRTICLAAIAGTLLLLPMNTSHAGTSFSFGISVTSVSDFYEPLGAYGSWIEVRDYGRCWRPAYIGTDWQPYGEGHWVWTDQGWYWESDEPWAWAAYHYGRWVWDPYYGWVWVPDTVWAPAWVCWREGGGYWGWAPMPPARFCGRDGLVFWENISWAPRAFIFVEFHSFCRPIHRHHHLPMDENRRLIHNTVNINNVTIIHNTVINNAPHIDTVRQRVGQDIPTGRVDDLWRHGSEQVVQRASLDRATPPPMTTRPAISADRTQRHDNSVATTPQREQHNRPSIMARPDNTVTSTPRREQEGRPTETARPAEPQSQPSRPAPTMTSRPQPQIVATPSRGASVNNPPAAGWEQRPSPSWSSARPQPQAPPQREFRASPASPDRSGLSFTAREQRPAPSSPVWSQRNDDTRGGNSDPRSYDRGNRQPGNAPTRDWVMSRR